MNETHTTVFRKKSEISKQDDVEALKNEMVNRLQEYKDEQKDSIHKMKPMKDENFKKNFFKSLENLLNQILNLKNEALKSQEISTLHKWFKGKLNFFHDITYIDKRTDKYHYERFEDVDTNKKTEYYMAKNYPTHFERDHRTEEEGLMPPKDK
jgi:hypothetical protein